MLSGELTTILTGRYIQIKIYPFSFREFLEYKNDYSKSIDELFNEYLIIVLYQKIVPKNLIVQSSK